MSLTIRSASGARPWVASQRGDSGTRARIAHTATAAKAPASITHRQPAIPSGSRGISRQQTKATVGTARNWMNWFTASARPRISRLTNSVM